MRRFRTTRSRSSARGVRADGGASTVEYALIVFAIAATIVMAVVALGPPVLGLYDGTCRAVRGGASGPASTCE
ncbi:MAG TPA: Flp family type IVb pilin [Actinomycetes bacterium]|nr:Flp family type IVb pilin [Actinomycetes bacterium]